MKTSSSKTNKIITARYDPRRPTNETATLGFTNTRTGVGVAFEPTYYRRRAGCRRLPRV